MFLTDQQISEMDADNRKTDALLWSLRQREQKQVMQMRRCDFANNLVRKEIQSGGTGLDFILSDETPDRYNDIILAAGWQLANFNRNPIALFNHDPDFPVGRWYDLRIERAALCGRLQLAPEGTSERVNEVRRLVEAGILRGVSVGFRPLESKRRHDADGQIYLRSELVECSLVSVPANPNALALAKSLDVSGDVMKLAFRDTSEPEVWTGWDAWAVNHIRREIAAIDLTEMLDDIADVISEVNGQLREEIDALRMRIEALEAKEANNVASA